MQANNLSKKLTPKPLTAAVTYRLLAAGKIDKRQSSIPMCPSHYSLRGEEVIFDPGDKPGDGKQKVLRYVIGTRPNSKTGNLEDVIGDIEIVGGQIVVKPTDTNLYEYLERSNYNASNPFRNPIFLAEFERLDPLAKAAAANEDDTTLEDALFALRELSPERKLEFATAKTLARSDDDMALVVRALRIYVKANPKKFLEELDSPELKARAIISQAIEHGIIQYVPTEGSYKWKEQGVLLYQVPQGFDGPTKLMEYLLTADAVPVTQLKELTKQVAAANKGK